MTTAKKTSRAVKWKRDGAFCVGRLPSGRLVFWAERCFMKADGWCLWVFDPLKFTTAATMYLALYERHAAPKRVKRGQKS